MNGVPAGGRQIVPSLPPSSLRWGTLWLWLASAMKMRNSEEMAYFFLPPFFVFSAAVSWAPLSSSERCHRSYIKPSEASPMSITFLTTGCGGAGLPSPTGGVVGPTKEGCVTHQCPCASTPTRHGPALMGLGCAQGYLLGIKKEEMLPPLPGCRIEA